MTTASHPYTIPAPERTGPAVALAIAMHALLALMLFFGLRWHSTTPAVVEAHTAAAAAPAGQRNAQARERAQTGAYATAATENRHRHQTRGAEENTRGKGRATARETIQAQAKSRAQAAAKAKARSEDTSCPTVGLGTHSKSAGARHGSPNLGTSGQRR